MRLLQGLLLTGLGTLTTVMVRAMPVMAQVAVPAIAETATMLNPAEKAIESTSLTPIRVESASLMPAAFSSTFAIEALTIESPERFRDVATSATTWQMSESATLERFWVQPDQAQREPEPLAASDSQPLLPSSLATPKAAPPRFAPTAKAVNVGGRMQLEITPKLTALAPERVTPEQMPTARSDAASRLLVTSQVAIEAAALDHVSSAQTTGYQGIPALPVAQLINSMRYPLGKVVPVTSGFGWRIHPLRGTNSFHAGIDLGADYGSPVLAAIGGQVIAVGNDGGYGLRVIVQNGQLQTVYAHLSRAYVTLGTIVQQGQMIGSVGSSGYATGPHLHLELRLLTVNGWQSIDFTAQLLASQRQTDRTIATLPSAGAITLRVGLLEDAASVTLTTSTPALILDTQNRPLASIQALQPFVTVPTASADGIQMGGGRMPPIFFLQPTANGAVAVGDRWYRGRVLVVARPHGLTVVNWVDLEAYLYSVVGAEAYPSWHSEALKAQAVAARSYALRFRLQPASELYDIGSDTRYQAYNGVASEYNTTAQAVEATRGQVLLDRAGGVLLAEYAATQDLTDSAHAGFGMSQWGAADLAQQGYSYLQILGRYYQGASLTLLAQR